MKLKKHYKILDNKERTQAQILNKTKSRNVLRVEEKESNL